MPDVGLPLLPSASSEEADESARRFASVPGGSRRRAGGGSFTTKGEMDMGRKVIEDKMLLRSDGEFDELKGSRWL